MPIPLMNLEHAIGSLSLRGKTLHFVDLPTVLGADLPRWPVVLRLLLENTLRHLQGDEQAAAAQALAQWLESGRSEAEVAFQPGRVL